MRNRRIVPIAVLLLGFAGCSRRPVVPAALLPVPAQDSRWEITQKDRVPLPLQDAGRNELGDALTWGLNRKNKAENVGADLNARKKYGPLFDLLSHNATLADLESAPYKKWFPGPMVKQVVDARDPDTPRPDHAPVALSDGTYWWVFYRNAQDQLTGVMVVKFNALQTLSEGNQ